MLAPTAFSMSLFISFSPKPADCPLIDGIGTTAGAFKSVRILAIASGARAATSSAIKITE